MIAMALEGLHGGDSRNALPPHAARLGTVLAQNLVIEAGELFLEQPC